MKIFDSIELHDRSYEVVIRIDGTTPVEDAQLSEFGEPLVDVGGTITGSATRPDAGSPTTVTITLPSKLVRLTSQFPVKEVFSLDDDSDADVMAKVWRNTIVARITAAKTTLMDLTENFVGETVTTI